MASKKNKNKKKSNSQSETKLAASAAIPYQTFRERSSPDGISLLKKIAIHVDNTQKETVLWKDIQQVFPHVLCIKNEDADVPFVKDDDFENLLPLRIVCLPDVVLNVVSKDSEIKEPVDIPMPALELLSLEIDIDPVQKPARRDPRGRDRDTLTSAQRLRHEMDAMKTLLKHSPPCRFTAEIMKGHGSVKREVMEPILYLLRSNDVTVLEPSLFALAKLVHQDEKNSKLAVELGALEDLNRLMRAAAPNIHGIALAVIREVIENVDLLDSYNPDIPPAAALALSRMTFDQDFKAEILQTRVLTLLSQMMRSNSYQSIRHSVRLFLALYKDLAIGTTHIEAAIIDRIVELISYKGNSDIHSYGSLQHLTIRTIFKWLEDESLAMKILITGSPEILTRVKEIANDAEACAPIPVEDLRDNVDLDPGVITMVQAGLIVDMLELKIMEEFPISLTIPTKNADIHLMARKKKNSRPSAAHTQSFQVVSLSGPPTKSPVFKINTILDTDIKSSYILWEDIQQQFGNVQYVMNDGVMIQFMRDASHEEIETQKDVTLEVVLQEPKHEVDDDASSMPDLELLSIADPEPKHNLETIHRGGASNAQNGSNNAQDVIEVKALYYLMRHMKEYEEKITVENFLEGKPLYMVSTLAFSNNLERQRAVAQYYTILSTQVDGPVSEDALGPLLHLLQSNDLEVQRSSTAALYRLSVNVENKKKIVELVAVEPLIRLMLSPDIAVHTDASACICSLAQLAEVEHTPQMVRLGALAPLARLVQSKEIDLQTNATGALNNISDCEELVEEVVKSGAVPSLIRLLGPGTPENIQQQCAEALCNISYDDIGRERLLKSKSTLVNFLGDLVKEGGIPPLLRLLDSDTQSAILSPICCLYNISVDPKNRALFAQPRIIKRLIDLQTRFKDEQINDRAALMLSALSNNKENHKMIIEAGAVERFYSSISSVSKQNQIQMTTLICQLSSEFDALIKLSKSSSEELQMRALYAMTGMASILSNYPRFQEAWHRTDCNLQELLCRMLESSDTEILSRGILSVVNLFEKGDDYMLELVVISDTLRPGLFQMGSLNKGVTPASKGLGADVLRLARRATGLFIIRWKEAEERIAKAAQE
ncbi:Vacuolar protein 8 [Dissophora globulifera]|nr:Vacuolar protein 8 [Dissophora globulifera]